MKTIIPRVIAAAFCTWALPAPAGPALVPFTTIQSDPVGQRLAKAMIWNHAGTEKTTGATVAFRKSIRLDQSPGKAVLHLFADARYILWVNGQYVGCGPARFQPNGPEYDSVDLTRKLQVGENLIALLVAGNLSGGKVMRHAPGLTALLEIDGKEAARTDASWKWSTQTRYRKVTASWADLRDAEIDARIEDGDWMLPTYADAAWQPAVTIRGDGWGPLTARRIPMLRETPVPCTFEGGVKLPVTLQAGQELKFHAGRIVQAYPVLALTAEAGAELTLQPFNVKYVAKSGPQTHFTIDSCGVMKGSIRVEKGSVTLTGFQLIERLYPFERIGRFQSNDAMLNRLWEICARSCEVLSEDAYVDCADRERVEWMDCDPPAFDVTRTAMAGPPEANGKPVFSDPRLLGEMVRRTALTLQPDGWVKAHTCSDRYDIHAKMEDRTCAWVEGIRHYYEATGDAASVREIWPAVVAQMDFFLKRRGDHGLVSARDWVVWGNPLGYITGQTATLNAFVCQAFADSAFLAGVIGEKSDGARFSQAAKELHRIINTVLWDEKSGGYYSGYFSEADLSATRADKRTLKLPLQSGLTPNTLHADVFALDRGIVPPSRRERVIANMLKQLPEPKDVRGANMIYYYILKQLYALDRPVHDDYVLRLFRERWQSMLDSPMQCSWESFGSGSHAHIYGMYPGYFLSAYVLGVRRDHPVSERKLLIEPHLGGLTRAEGVVVTEFGPVPVSWKRENGRVNFAITIPPDLQTVLALPDSDDIQIDGASVKGTVSGPRRTFPLKAGVHHGSYPAVMK